jgi:hypothetical protein
MAPFGDVSIHVWSTWNLPVFIRQTEPSTVVRILFARSYLATVLLLDTRSPLARSFDPWLLRRTVRRAVRSDIWHERVHCLEGALLDQLALVCQPSAISHLPSAISHPSRSVNVWVQPPLVLILVRSEADHYESHSQFRIDSECCKLYTFATTR